MQSNEASEETPIVESPCVGICAVKNRFCIGCFRTIKEIGAWSTLSPSEKQDVLDAIQMRREALA